MDPDADLIVVFGGTNDFDHGDAPFGTFEDRTNDTFCGALHVLCRSLLARYPASRIMFMTPLHRTTATPEDKPTVKQDGKANVLLDYVNAIRRTAEYYSLPVLDLYAVSGMQPAVDAIRERYMPDGLHPNDNGHARLTELIARFIENTL